MTRSAAVNRHDCRAERTGSAGLGGEEITWMSRCSVKHCSHTHLEIGWRVVAACLKCSDSAGVKVIDPAGEWVEKRMKKRHSDQIFVPTVWGGYRLKTCTLRSREDSECGATYCWKTRVILSAEIVPAGIRSGFKEEPWRSRKEQKKTETYRTNKTNSFKNTHRKNRIRSNLFTHFRV